MNNRLEYGGFIILAVPYRLGDNNRWTPAEVCQVATEDAVELLRRAYHAGLEAEAYDPAHRAATVLDSVGSDAPPGAARPKFTDWSLASINRAETK